MKIRNKFNQMKKELSNNSSNTIKDHNEVKKIPNKEAFTLEKKIDNILQWYQHNFSTSQLRDDKTFMKDTIEKMAVWYELKYPIKSFTRESNFGIDIGKEKKFYTYDGIYHNDRIMDTHEYFQSLSPEERKFIETPKYPSEIPVLDSNGMKSSYCIKLSPKGYIVDDKNISKHLTKIDNKPKSFKGWHITDFYEYLKKYNYESPNILRTLDEYKNKTMRKELFLKAVLYRIIERGYAYIGPMRGLKFAKEFDLDIDIPMYYVSYSELDHYNSFYTNNYAYKKENIRMLINEYLKAGGDLNRTCLKDYWYSLVKNEPFEMTTVKEILEETASMGAFTKEEHEMHQKITDLINAELIKRETSKENVYALNEEHKAKIRQKRIERGLNRSRSRSNSI